MRIQKTFNQEILVKFNEVTNAKELDEMIYKFEQNMTQKEHDYFLKESENPYIFFLEYSKPQELIKEIQEDNEINNLVTTLPVVCVLNNMNYITSTILRKIRHKISSKDTFNITCHTDQYQIFNTAQEIEQELTKRIHEIIDIPAQKIDPMWNIDIYLIGDICAINIKRSNKNRNKFSQYNNC